MTYSLPLKNSPKNFSKKFTPRNYQDAAVLAQTVAEEMLSRLQLITMRPQNILDVGCGTGSGIAQLKHYYPGATIFSLDIAYPMLQFMRSQDISNYFIHADSHVLPFKNNSIDLLFANFLLPWCSDIEKIFSEWRRVLRPDGLLMFTCLGPDTLREWSEELKDFIAPNFIDMHDIGDALLRNKFVDPVMDVDYITLKFSDAEKMLAELQASEMLINSELPQINKNNISARFEIIYGHAWGPQNTIANVADSNGIVKIPVEQLRNNKRISRE